MIDITEKQRQRAVSDKKAFLINELYRFGLNESPCGRKFEECSLFTLEQTYINERYRIGRSL